MSGFCVLPPADAILEQVAPLLLQTFASKDIAIGGGTALAARWCHRQSTDIDMTVPHDMFIGVRVQLAERLTASSLTGIRHGQDWLNGETTEGEFSIATIAPLLPHPSVPSDHETMFGLLLDPTSEILARKLRLRIYGNGEFVSRDFYDICTAAERDPVALDQALSTLSAGERIDIAEEIASLGAKAASSGRELKDVHRPHWLPSLASRTAELIVDGPTAADSGLF